MNIFKKILLDTPLYDNIIPTKRSNNGVTINSFNILDKVEDIEENSNIYYKVGNKLVLDTFNDIKDKIGESNKIYVLDYKKGDAFFLNTLYDLIIMYRIKDQKEKYSFAYNKVCDLLDGYFNKYNICDFKDNYCARKRELIGRYDNKTLVNGCCFTKGRLCPYFIDGKCTKRCLADKIFTCGYLKRKGIRFRVSDFLVLKEILNIRGLYLVDNSLFHDEEELYNVITQKKGFK